MKDWNRRPSNIRVDPRDDTIEEVRTVLDHKNVPKGGKRIREEQALYRWNCMNGERHPLDIESDHYVLLTVCTQSIDIAVRSSDSHFSRHQIFNANEIEFIESVKHRPEIEWAIDNSFDGLYITRHEESSMMRMGYRFAVYLKEEHATFWKLKFGSMYGTRGSY